MASTSSREAALERRKALTNGGKKATGRYTSSPSRVRTAADARPTRTNTPAPEVAAEPVASTPRPSTQTSRPSRSLSAAPAAGHRSAAKPVSNPSRELVLARDRKSTRLNSSHT